MTEARTDRATRAARLLRSARGLAPVVAALALAALLAGCRGTPLDALFPLRTEIPHEDMPLYASMWITTEPEVTPADLTIDLADEIDGTTFRSIDVPAGTLVRLDEGMSEGKKRLTWLGGRCTAVVDLPAERKTHAVLSLDESCTSTAEPFVVGEDGPGSGYVAATVTVQPWPEYLVEAVSLDDPPLPVPDPVPPDEGGLAQLMPLTAGRYEIRLVHDGRIVERQSVVIDGNERSGAVELTFDGIPD